MTALAQHIAEPAQKAFTSFADFCVYGAWCSSDKKKDKNKIKSVSLFTYKNKSLYESKIYECKHLNLMKKYKYFLVEVVNKKK